MNPKNKERYVAALDEDIGESERALGTVLYARSVSDTKMQSRYDTQREDHDKDAQVREAQLEAKRALRAFIVGVESQTTVVPGAEFKIQFGDDSDDTESYIFATIGGRINGITVITPDSPIGGSIQGKGPGETFTYSPRHGVTMRATVLEVE